MTAASVMSSLIKTVPNKNSMILHYDQTDENHFDLPLLPDPLPPDPLLFDVFLKDFLFALNLPEFDDCPPLL